MGDHRSDRLHRVEFGMEWPPGHVACYVLDSAEPVLFDAGTPDGVGDGPPGSETFHEGLAEIGYDPGDIEHLVVTHPHVDHVGQVPTVLDAGDPTVYAPAGIRDRFAGDADALAERVRANARAGGLTGEQLTQAAADAVESLERDRRLLPPDAVDVWVEPGQVTFGTLSAEAIHTPGHQADHLAYLLEDRRLISGDAVLDPFRAVVLHDGLDDGHSEAFDAYYTALDRLAGRDVDRVYPGHGPVHERFDEILTRDRESLDRRLDRVVELVEAGYETVPAVAAELSGDRPTRYMLPETMSALAHLRATGRIDATRENGVYRHR